VNDIEGCPFCSPARERVRFTAAPGMAALVNLKPILEGHTLIVPERHADRLLELSPDEVAGLAAFARRVSAFLMDELPASGIDWTLQDGAEAGQTVMHLHLHLIPRRPGDLPTPGDWYEELRASHARPALPETRLDALVRRLRSAAVHSSALR
jgi:bis(5'-adenosyl)-triphosphatase